MYIPLLFLSLSNVAVYGLSTTKSISTLTGSALASARSDNCAQIASSCPFAQSACVSYWCNGGCSDNGGCCTQAQPQACLVKANLQNACFNMENSVILCPNNSALPSCLCYDSAGNYIPQSYDGMAQSCSQIAVTASPQLLSLITGTGGSLGFCTKVFGPASNSFATTTASATSPTADVATGGSKSSTPVPSATPPSAYVSSPAKSTASSQYEISFWAVIFTVAGMATL